MIAYWVRIVFVETMKHVKLSAQCTGWEGVTEMTCGWLAMFYFSYWSLFCDPSLEPSHWDDSSDGPSHIFFLRIGKDSTNWPLSPLLSWAFCGKCFLKKIKKNQLWRAWKKSLRCVGIFQNLYCVFCVSERGRLGDFLCAFLDNLDFSPIALRKAKVVYSFGLSDCNMVEWDYLGGRSLT